MVAGSLSEIPEEHHRILTGKGFAHVATLGPSGEPQSSVVWYGLDGPHLVFSHTKSRQKYRNLTRDPRIAVSIHDPDDPYLHIEIRGRAEIEDDPEGLLIREMSKKYRGSSDFKEKSPQERVVVRVVPERVICYGDD